MKKTILIPTILFILAYSACFAWKSTFAPPSQQVVQQPSPFQNTSAEPPQVNPYENNELDAALLEAAESGNEHEVKTLLVKGANPNASHKVDDSLTALMLAASNGHCEIADLLLAYGADVNAKASKTLNVYQQTGLKNTTALLWAAEDGNFEMVELLLAHGAEVDAQYVSFRYENNVEVREKGDTALSWAVNTRVIKLLLEYGANPDIASEDGSTPLMAVAWRGDIAAAKALIAKGADVNAQTKDGVTALRNAVSGKHRNMVRFLKRAGAAE